MRRSVRSVIAVPDRGVECEPAFEVEPGLIALAADEGVDLREQLVVDVPGPPSTECAGRPSLVLARLPPTRASSGSAVCAKLLAKAMA